MRVLSLTFERLPKSSTSPPRRILPTFYPQLTVAQTVEIFEEVRHPHPFPRSLSPHISQHGVAAPHGVSAYPFPAHERVGGVGRR